MQINKQMEEIKKEKIALGYVARGKKNDNYVNYPVTMPPELWFDLVRAQEVINNAMLWLKQQHFENDTFRWYFEEDLVEVENEKGEKQKTIRSDFWN